MNKTGTCIGVDLGGTSLRIGEVDEQGHILRMMCRQSQPGMENACRQIEDMLHAFLADTPQEHAPVAIGVGIAGHVDGETGEWISLDDAESLRIPLASRLKETFHLPCRIDNDVKSATRAEMRYGVGRVSRDFVYINVGTGLAAGIVSGGRLINGGHANAGEVGHISSGLNTGLRCVCGRQDCAELYASGMGMDMRARRLRPDYPNTRLNLPDSGRVNAADIFRLYDDDSLCRRLVDDAAEALANAIMNMVRLTDPDTVVLGGGVMKAGFLLEKALKLVQPHTMRYVTGGVRLTQLSSDHIALIGAAVNGMEGILS